MLTITRGIDLHVETAHMRLCSGPVREIQFGAIPLRVWLTYGGRPEPATGLVVNVSLISRAVRQLIGGEQPLCRNGYELMAWMYSRLHNRFAGCYLRRVDVQMALSYTMTLLATEMNMLYLTYHYELAASHRLWNQAWQLEQNVSVFGKCANPAGHGHNYLLEITLAGTPDPQTAEIIPAARVDDIVRQEILERFDHKNLNSDTPEFRECVPTVENMALVFWSLLEGRFHPARLARLKVWETPHTYAEYDGQPG